jgi:type VI secretion system protein ImpH
MAAASRTQNTSLVAGKIQARLWNEPFAFEFFQAVRLLERLMRDRKRVGGFSDPKEEVARFGVNVSLSFPPSDIHTLDAGQTGPARMMVNFMGLLGAHGVLPRSYTELALERTASPLRDFLDLFHHRLISLFYAGWRKYRTIAQNPEDEVGGEHALSKRVLDVIGLGTQGLRNRQAVQDERLRLYAGLLVQQPRSATALRLLLEDYFDVPVFIEQFVGAWYPLETRAQCTLDEMPLECRQLGGGAVVGDEVWEPRAKVRVVLGPLTRKQYLDFLPAGTAYAPLRAMVRFFSDEIDFEAQLVLAADEAPSCELGTTGDMAPRLGWMTWVKTRSMDRNPADTIILL